MKPHTLKNVFKFTFFAVITALFVLVAFSVRQGLIAEGADFGSITVNYDGEKYVCTDGTESFNDTSLQNVIDYAESKYSQTVFYFNCHSVTEPLVFKKYAVLQGNLDFALTADSYALTVANGATLILQGAVINSNRGAVKVGYNGTLEVRSATVTVADCNLSHSAINVSGTARIGGGKIVYADNNGFGFGVSVNGGSLNITPEEDSSETVPVIIEGNSGLCVSAGNAEINGGEFIANRTVGTSARYSVNVQDGSLTINGGVFDYPIYDIATASAKVNINGGSVSSVRVTPYQNKKINIGSLELYTGSYCEIDVTNIDFATNTLTVEGKKSIVPQGLKIVGFNVDGTRVDEPVLTLDTNEQKTVIPIEDNSYTVSLSCDGTVFETVSYTYGSTVELNTLPAPEKTGYVLSGWQEKKSDFIIYDDVTLTAVMVLADTQIEIMGTELTYNGTEQTITPVFKHDLPVTFTAYWERYAAGGWEKISESADLKVTTVADGGAYRINVLATYGEDTSHTQKEITVTVNKGRYENISHREFSGVYDPEKRLSSYALDADFSWVDVKTTPTVPIKHYPAIYNADPDNYEDCEVFITIDLEKAEGVIAPPHPNLSGVYQKKQLKDYALNDGFRWQTPDEIPIVNKQAYVALYNPDTDNYNDTLRSIVLRLQKGTYEEVEHLGDITMTFRPNYFMSDLSRDISNAYANYRLQFSTDSRVNAGTATLTCVYNDDADNYNDYTFTIGLTVNKADIDSSAVPNVTPFTNVVYKGLHLSSFALVANVYWRNPELIPTVDVQEYEAYYNPEPQNYNDYPMTVIIMLQKGTYDDVSAPSLNAITYDRYLTLSDVPLPEGWSWTDTTVTPTVAVGSYNAQYCADPINYLPFALNIPLTVNKADIELAVLPDKTVTYDGTEYFLAFEYLPYPLVLVGYENNGKSQAGKYEITAKLKQTDTDNYNLHPTTVRGILTILKASSVINAPSRYDILEGSSLTIIGTVENNEQHLVIPEFNETTCGLYYVTLTTAESGNYLAGEHTVTISINKTEKYVGNISYPSTYDGSYLYGILVNTDSGVPNDAQITFRPFPCENYHMGIEISVTVDGKTCDKKFTAKIKMTDEMLSASTLTLFDEDGREIAFTVENNAYLVFETEGYGVFLLQAEFNNKFAWYWIPIGIALALIAICVILVVLWKKGIIKLSKKTHAVQERSSKANPEEDDKVAEEIKEQ